MPTSHPTSFHITNSHMTRVRHVRLYVVEWLAEAVGGGWRYTGRQARRRAARQPGRYKSGQEGMQEGENVVRRSGSQEVRKSGSQEDRKVGK